jgi:peptide-methionine (R)-S-oxide reductase
MAKIEKTDEQWRETLSSDEFHVCREHGTERAFTGEYWNTKDPGTYRCTCCGEPLFDSTTKFDSGTGWPSFWKPLSDTAVGESVDRSHMMVRIEVHCAKCGAHLGHMFEDGPKPTGLRYCINSVSLKLDPTEKGADEKT